MLTGNVGDTGRPFTDTSACLPDIVGRSANLVGGLVSRIRDSIRASVDSVVND